MSESGSLALRNAYTEAYFLEDCGGYETYRQSGGKVLDLRLEIMARLAQMVRRPPPWRVLDLGCGRGEMLRYFAAAGHTVVGIDYSPAAIALAEACFAGEAELRARVDLHCGSVTDAAFYSGGFDLVLASDVIEHLAPAELDAMYAQVAKHLNPDGLFVLHTFPNHWYYRYGHPWRRRAALARGEELPLEPRSAYERQMHINEQTPPGLRRQLRRHFPAVLLWAGDHEAPGGSLARRFGKNDWREARSLFAVVGAETIAAERVLAVLATPAPQAQASGTPAPQAQASGTPAPQAQASGTSAPQAQLTGNPRSEFQADATSAVGTHPLAGPGTVAGSVVAQTSVSSAPASSAPATSALTPEPQARERLWRVLGLLRRLPGGTRLYHALLAVRRIHALENEVQRLHARLDAVLKRQPTHAPPAPPPHQPAPETHAASAPAPADPAASAPAPADPAAFAPAPADPAASAPAPSRRMDIWYQAFEEHFRGPAEVIQERLKVYLPRVAQAPVTPAAPWLDLGCGRGDWLQLLHQQGYAARGIDSNPQAVAAACARQLDAMIGDGLPYLRTLAPSTLGGVSALHLLEHLPFAETLDILSAAHRALVPGGLLLLETPNPENLSVGACHFHTDPTHQTPLIPDMLAFTVQHLGFTQVEILRLHPVEAAAHLDATDATAARVNALVYGPRDFAIVAWRPQ